MLIFTDENGLGQTTIHGLGQTGICGVGQTIMAMNKQALHDSKATRQRGQRLRATRGKSA